MTGKTVCTAEAQGSGVLSAEVPARGGCHIAAAQGYSPGRRKSRVWVNIYGKDSPLAFPRVAPERCHCSKSDGAAHRDQGQGEGQEGTAPRLCWGGLSQEAWGHLRSRERRGGEGGGVRRGREVRSSTR